MRLGNVFYIIYISRNESVKLETCATKILQILVYYKRRGMVLEWVAAVPNHVPNQAVMFENRSNTDAMFVARVSSTWVSVGGSYIPNKSCVEYKLSSSGVLCTQTFDFLVFKHGKPSVSQWDSDILIAFSFFGVSSIWSMSMQRQFSRRQMLRAEFISNILHLRHSL